MPQPAIDRETGTTHATQHKKPKGSRNSSGTQPSVRNIKGNHRETYDYLVHLPLRLPGIVMYTTDFHGWLGKLVLKQVLLGDTISAVTTRRTIPGTISCRGCGLSRPTPDTKKRFASSSTCGANFSKRADTPLSPHLLSFRVGFRRARHIEKDMT